MKSGAQVLLKYQIYRGVIVIPKSDVEKVVEAAELKVEKDALREHEALHNGEESIRAYLAKVVK